MITFALDTNIISYILRENENVIRHYQQEAFNNNRFIMPPVAYFEVKRGLLELGAKNRLAAFEQMCSVIPLGEITRYTWNVAAELYVKARKTGNAHSDADLIIAAFCVANGYTLVTNNIRHFKFIHNLKLVNWIKD